LEHLRNLCGQIWDILQGTEYFKILILLSVASGILLRGESRSSLKEQLHQETNLVGYWGIISVKTKFTKIW
jgi:hypothetical protein